MQVISGIQKVAASPEAWPKLPQVKKNKILSDLIAYCESQRDELELLLQDSMGYPKWAAEDELDHSIEAIKFYSQKAEANLGSLPHGLLGIVLQSGSPVYDFVSVVVPALLLGNQVILLTSAAKGELVRHLLQALSAAGLPEEALQLIIDDQWETVEILATHPATKGIVFFGTKPDGDRLQRSLWDSGKFVHIETGGRNSVIIGRDLDFAKHGESLKKVFFSSHFLSSFRGSRVFVPENQWDPILSEIRELVSEAKAEGIVDTPNVVEDVSNCAPSQQEILSGSTLTITRYKSAAEACKFANTSPWGLAAYVFNNDEEKAKAWAEKLRVGHVFVNKFAEKLYAKPVYRYGDSGRTSGRSYWDCLQVMKTIL